MTFCLLFLLLHSNTYGAIKSDLDFLKENLFKSAKEDLQLVQKKEKLFKKKVAPTIDQETQAQIENLDDLYFQDTPQIEGVQEETSTVSPPKEKTEENPKRVDRLNGLPPTI